MVHEVYTFFQPFGISPNSPPCHPEEGHTYKFHTILKRRHLAVVLCKDGRDVIPPDTPPSPLYPWWPLFQIFSWCQDKSVFGYYITHFVLIIWKFSIWPRRGGWGSVKIRRFPFQEHHLFKRGSFHAISPKKKHLRTRELQILTPGPCLPPVTSFGRNLFLGHFWPKWPKWQGVSLMVFLGKKLFCCKNGRNIPHLVHMDALITNPSFHFGVRCCLVAWGG